MDLWLELHCALPSAANLRCARFLRVPGLTSGKTWSRLHLHPGFASAFESLFAVLATRTTKALVAQETQIPAQERMVFAVQSSPIEEEYYLDTLTRALAVSGWPPRLDRRSLTVRVQDLGFDADGNGFDLDLAKARTWVHTLRQIATHLQIGALAGGPGAGAGAGGVRARRLNLGGELLSLVDVLQRMVDQKVSDLASQQRAMLNLKIDREWLHLSC